MPHPPSGTVTFLFTDIEGSTKHWEAHPQEMQAAFARQEDILRASVEANGGYLYKMIGDAFQVAFPTAPQALQAAIDAQRALHSENWPAGSGELRVRMALHTGITEERGDDYLGPVLNRAARLLSAGYGGQVLLSRATYELVRDLLPDGVSLLDLGEHRLKDLFRPEHVFQLSLADLPSEFPALKTLDYRPNNLPRQTTALVGREKEVQDVRALLRRGDVTLVALVGPGGIGKSRLALQAAADLLDDFPDGVWLVELSALTDSGLVVSAIASALGLQESPNEPLTLTLKGYLRDRQILLVLDTFEQVTGAARLVNEILAAAPRVKAIVTSRQALRLYGEWDYQVPPLSLPDHKRLPPIEKLTQYDAVRLFIDRAQAAKAGFEITTDNAPAVAEVCVRLDGLPLAIELAAARIRLLPPQAMLARLRDRFALLSGGARDLPHRQQTIRNTIEWSYELLDGGEKQLFRRLSVFRGGCTLEAAESVCNFDAGLQIDVIEGVEGLVDKSLLRQEEGSTGEPRLLMLETIYEYAEEKLAGSDHSSEDVEALKQAHARYFADLVEFAEPQLRGIKQGEWLDRLEEEQDNLRAALDWAVHTSNRGPETGSTQVDPGPAEFALRIAGGLWRFWYARGYLSEGREQLSRVLALPVPTAPLEEPKSGAATPKPLDPFRTRAFIGAAFVSYRQGNYDEARSLFGEALALAREHSDKNGIALSLNGLGMMDQEQGSYISARSMYEESLALRRESGDKYGVAASLNNLAIVAQEQSDYPAARSLLEESLALAREVGDRQGIATALINLGVVAKEQQDYTGARSLFEESLALERELANRWGIALVLGNLADIERDQGDQVKANTLYRESLALERELRDMRGIARTLEGMAAVDALQSREERAARLWGAAEALREAIGAPLPQSERSQYEQALSKVRLLLGEQSLEKSWQAGRAMGTEQAIDYALRGP